jgi:hypothetical protein
MKNSREIGESGKSSPVPQAIALMMEAASTPVMSVNFYQTTRHNILKDSHFHIRCSENLKFHHDRGDCLLQLSKHRRMNYRGIRKLVDLKDGCRLDCSTVWSGRSLSTFQRCLLRWVSLMMEAARASEYVCKLLPDYTVIQPRRQPSSNSPPWEPEISPR